MSPWYNVALVAKWKLSFLVLFSAIWGFSSVISYSFPFAGSQYQVYCCGWARIVELDLFSGNWWWWLCLWYISFTTTQDRLFACEGRISYLFIWVEHSSNCPPLLSRSKGSDAYRSWFLSKLTEMAGACRTNSNILHWYFWLVVQRVLLRSIKLV